MESISTHSSLVMSNTAATSERYSNVLSRVIGLEERETQLEQRIEAALRVAHKVAYQQQQQQQHQSDSTDTYTTSLLNSKPSSHSNRRRRSSEELQVGQCTTFVRALMLKVEHLEEQLAHEIQQRMVMQRSIEALQLQLQRPNEELATQSQRTDVDTTVETLSEYIIKKKRASLVDASKTELREDFPGNATPGESHSSGPSSPVTASSVGQHLEPLTHKHVATGLESDDVVLFKRNPKARASLDLNQLPPLARNSMTASLSGSILVKNNSKTLQGGSSTSFSQGHVSGEPGPTVSFSSMPSNARDNSPWNEGAPEDFGAAPAFRRPRNQFERREPRRRSSGRSVSRRSRISTDGGLGRSVVFGSAVLDNENNEPGVSTLSAASPESVQVAAERTRRPKKQRPLPPSLDVEALLPMQNKLLSMQLKRETAEAERKLKGATRGGENSNAVAAETLTHSAATCAEASPSQQERLPLLSPTSIHLRHLPHDVHQRRRWTTAA
ncbi:hypothetical protein DQ04_03031000 [Trypanosoma grayi]|uniref:hypothetical protein n=1 Tax=Trypanosoma grayi TaxID=71804 RepID=UPI0004F42742|nr:hypothetical protein DQ04_03031000 [Trypanosoma grayi]KEG11042.1 hypothetical protein DQ04_03031000 [Trypanosoma grayi]